LEQSNGVDQVNKALTQMDEVTQRNAALVEENAATAKTLEQQAKVMDERVGYFSGLRMGMPQPARRSRPGAAARRGWRGKKRAQRIRRRSRSASAGVLTTTSLPRPPIAGDPAGERRPLCIV
jgi:hypothetical protein